MSEARLPQSKPTLVVAYALAVLGGVFGAHRFYLHENGTATALLLVTIASIALMVVAIGFFTIWISLIWVIADLLLIPRLVRKAAQR